MKTLLITAASILAGGLLLLAIFAATWTPKPMDLAEARKVLQQIKPGPPAAAVAKPDPAADNRRLETCRARLKKAQRLDMLRDLKWDGRSEPYVLDGPTFDRVDVTAKQGFAATLNCFLTAGREHTLVNFDVHDWRTGKVVGRYFAGELQMN